MRLTLVDAMRLKTFNNGARAPSMTTLVAMCRRRGGAGGKGTFQTFPVAPSTPLPVTTSPWFSNTMGCFLCFLLPSGTFIFAGANHCCHLQRPYPCHHHMRTCRYHHRQRPCRLYHHRLCWDLRNVAFWLKRSCTSRLAFCLVFLL